MANPAWVCKLVAIATTMIKPELRKKEWARASLTFESGRSARTFVTKYF